MVFPGEFAYGLTPHLNTQGNTISVYSRTSRKQQERWEAFPCRTRSWDPEPQRQRPHR